MVSTSVSRIRAGRTVVLRFREHLFAVLSHVAAGDGVAGALDEVGVGDAGTGAAAVVRVAGADGAFDGRRRGFRRGLTLFDVVVAAFSHVTPRFASCSNSIGQDLAVVFGFVAATVTFVLTGVGIGGIVGRAFDALRDFGIVAARVRATGEFVARSGAGPRPARVAA